MLSILGISPDNGPRAATGDLLGFCLSGDKDEDRILRDTQEIKISQNPPFAFASPVLVVLSILRSPRLEIGFVFVSESLEVGFVSIDYGARAKPLDRISTNQDP